MDGIEEVEATGQNFSPAIQTVESAYLKTTAEGTVVACQTRLIPDSPSEQDAFGPHGRIAIAIADLIQSTDEKCSIAIGLEGEWGSGKSTVVKLLDARLSADKKNYTLVLFNAWAHEGDPLRRTFLETLIQHLSDVGWLEGKEKEWQDEQDIIAQRKEKKRTTSNPYLTNFGKLLGSSFLLIPLGAALLSKVIDRNNRLTLNPDWYLTLYVFLGVMFSLAPFWLFIIFKLVQLVPFKRLQGWLQSTGQKAEEKHCANSRTEKTEDSTPAEQKRGTSLWHMIFNKVITEEQTITTKRPNPTAIEFEEIFKHLMRDALTGDSDKEAESRQLVIVLDNLDRIAPGDALSIWSTLQTFLKQRDSKDEWFRRVWVLVPYDRIGLSQLWESDKASKGSNAASFMDKSFQVRFEVPQPVPSHWREFLISLLKQAFPDHLDEAEFHKVYRALALQMRQVSDVPTIRELKLYVNQIVSLHRQWHHTFPLSHLAYFALLRRPEKGTLTGINIAAKLVAGGFPEPAFTDLLGKEIVNNLAALHFNVEAENAQQLLLKGPIRTALTLFEGHDLESKAEELRTLSLLPGFWTVLTEFIETEWATTEATVIANAARCLNASGVLQGGSEEIADVKTALKRAASSVESWAKIDPLKADGMKPLFEVIGEESFGIQLLSKATMDMIEEEEIRLSQSDDKEKVTQTHLWAKDLQDTRTCVVESLKWPEAFDKAVIDPLFLNLRIAPRGEIKFLILMETLFELSMFDDGARQRLKSLVEEGHIARRLNGKEFSGFHAIALSLFALMRNSSEADEGLKAIVEIFREIPDSNWGEIAKPFTDYLVRFKELRILFRLIAAEDLKPFVENCFKHFAGSGMVDGIYVGTDDLNLDPQLIINHWKFLKEIKASSTDAPAYQYLNYLVNRFINGTALIPYLLRQNLDIATASLYTYIAGVEAEGEAMLRFKRWLWKGLQGVSEDTWHSQISERGDLLFLAFMVAIDLKEKDSYWLDPYQRGLIKHIEEVIGDEAATFDPGEMTSILVKNPAALKSFRQNLYHLLAKHVRSGIAPIIFQRFSTELSDPEIISRNMEELLDISVELLKQRHTEGLNWVAAALSIAPLEHLSAESIERLELSVQAAIKSPNRAFSSVVQRIMNVLKLNSPEVVAEKYRQIISELSRIEDYDSRQAFIDMLSKSRFFSLPEGYPPQIAPYQERLDILLGMAVKDVEGLGNMLMKTLRNYLGAETPQSSQPGEDSNSPS